jgi:predicted Zn-dependent protease
MSKKSLLLILAVSFCFYAGCAVNPITGERRLMLISEQQDFEVGRQYAPEVEKEMGGRIENQSVQNYIDNVGQRIARVSHKPYWEYHFVALNHKSINAFTLPGGYVFITQGMLKKLTTEAQLAGILAHEIVHVVARHYAAAASRESSESGIMILAAALSGAKVPRGAFQAADLARQIIGLRYSRKDEREADLAGLDYMVVAGYNPYGVIESMQMLEGENTIRPVEFFSTHPDPQNRLAYLEGRIQTRYGTVSGLRTGKEDYHRFVLEPLANLKNSKEP